MHIDPAHQNIKSCWTVSNSLIERTAIVSAYGASLPRIKIYSSIYSILDSWFIPVNDFIFSVVGEEFGFLGCLGVLAVMFVIISRCIKISLTSEDNLGALVAGGVAGMLCFQTFVNVGVATGILPNTGMPFPFMSYGGSAMWVDMICIGIVLSVGMKKPKSMF